LPDGTCEKAVALQARQCLYGYLSRPLIDDLVAFCAGHRVLECYAGRGQLSALLAEQGVEVKATSLRQGHDASHSLGHVGDVEELSVTEAVAKYRDWLDILLVCWPTTDGGLERTVELLGEGARIVFIGEVTDYGRSPPFLGGCATDGFFEAVEEVPGTRGLIRYPTFRQDVIRVYRRRSTGC
jgi:hypothetical protein